MRVLVEVMKSTVKFLNKLDGYRFDSRYVSDNRGQVYLVKADHDDSWLCLPLQPFITRDGYVEYVLTLPNKTKKHIQAQRIVAGLYCKKKPNTNYVNHKNGIRYDNHYLNLEWVTQSENITHSYRVLRTRWNNKVKRFELY